MHGLIFLSLRDYSIELLGEERAAPLWADRTFEATEAYDDEWFRAQLDRVAAASGDSRAQAELGFGVFAARETFASLYPDYYRASDGVVPFLLGIEEKIHELVRATVRGARPPRLHVQPLGDDGVLISYTSERGLCRLLEGLVRGAAERLGEAVEVEEIQCMHHDDPGCVFTVVAASGES